MSSQCSWIIVIGASFACLAPSVRAEVKVQPDKENVVGSRLLGKWEADAELTKRLGGEAAASLTFLSDEAIAAKIPAKFETFLKDRQVFLAGMVTLAGIDEMRATTIIAPFILTEHRGNPCLVFFLPKDGDAFANPESAFLMLAVAKDTANDLLFLGGDVNNQPFGAYRRVQGDAKP